MPQTEIITEVPVLDELGRPQNFGWARSPCLKFDRSLLRVSERRINESDRYIVISPSHMVVFEILDDGYLGYMLISVASLKDKKRVTQSFITPFSLGSFNLPTDSQETSIKIRKKKNLLDFAIMEEGVRIIKVDIPRFGHHRSLRGELVLTPLPESESLFTNMPWRGTDEVFCCSRRSPWYCAEGVIQFGTSEIVFTRNKGWGIFEWNRGVRPTSDLRFWASGCGMVEGHHIAFNVGYNSADLTQGTENAFFLDGRLHKLDQVTFHILLGRHVPWRFTSNDNRLEMTFSPHQERSETHQMFFYYQRRRQLFGSFSGKVILDDGSLFEFKNITGMAERRKTRL